MRAGEGQREAAEVVDGGNACASSVVYSAAALAWAASPKTRAKITSTFLK